MSDTVAHALPAESGVLRGGAFLAYSAASYLAGVAGLAALMFATARLIPLGWFRFTGSPTGAIPVDVGLLLLFGVQHSVMARPGFKQLLARILPPALERSTFVWTSGVVLGAVVAFWQPVGGELWRAQGVWYWAVLSGSLFGWLYLLAATFAISHWDLFGLRQAWLAARGLEYRDVPFVEKWMYRYSRHPIQAGVLLGVWCLPVMTGSQAMLSAGLSAYMVVGLYFEERDLLRQWGERYRGYKRRVGAFFTL